MEQCLALGWLGQIYMPAACRGAVRLHTHTHTQTQTNTHIDNCTHTLPHTRPRTSLLCKLILFIAIVQRIKALHRPTPRNPTPPRYIRTPSAFVSMEQTPLDRHGERRRGLVAAAAHVTAFFSGCERRNSQHISCHTPPHSHTFTHTYNRTAYVA